MGCMLNYTRLFSFWFELVRGEVWMFAPSRSTGYEQRVTGLWNSAQNEGNDGKWKRKREGINKSLGIEKVSRRVRGGLVLLRFAGADLSD